MRYNSTGQPQLHRLGKSSSFEEVWLTLRHLGYGLSEATSSADYVSICWDTPGKYGPMFNSRAVKAEEVTEWLNNEMESRGIITKEAEL